MNWTPIPDLSSILNKSFKDDISVFIRDKMNYDSIHQIPQQPSSNSTEFKDVKEEIYELSLKNICNTNMTCQVFSAYLIFNLSLEFQVNNKVFDQAVNIIQNAKNDMSIVPDYLRDEIIEIQEIICVDYSQQINENNDEQFMEENTNQKILPDVLNFDVNMNEIFIDKVENDNERDLAKEFIQNFKDYKKINNNDAIFELFYKNTNRFNNLEILFDLMENRRELYVSFFRFLLSFVMILAKNNMGNFRFLNNLNSKLGRTSEAYNETYRNIGLETHDFSDMKIPIAELENLDNFEKYFSRALECVCDFEQNFIYHILAALNTEGQNAIYHFTISLTYATLQPSLRGIPYFADLADLFFPKNNALFYVFSQFKQTPLSFNNIDFSCFPSPESFNSVSELFFDSNYFYLLIERLPEQRNNLKIINAYHNKKYSYQRNINKFERDDIKRIFFSKIVDHLNSLYVYPGSKIYHN